MEPSTQIATINSVAGINVKRERIQDANVISEIESIVKAKEGSLTLISGQTGSGKSTLAKSIIKKLAKDYKVVALAENEIISDEIVRINHIGADATSFMQRCGVDFMLVDELRSSQHVEVILNLLDSGISVIATIHGHEAKSAISHMKILFLSSGEDDDERSEMNDRIEFLIANELVHVVQIGY